MDEVKMSEPGSRPLGRPLGCLAARRVVAIAVGLLISVSGLGALPPGAAAASPDYVILIDGLCSSLPAGTTLPPQFTTPGGLVDRLVAAGRAPDSIVAYSYRGGSLVAGGLWQPAPYECADSRDQSLVQDVDVLDTQLASLLAIHPGAAFHLVGFSLGGLVAFAEVARLTTVDGWTLPNGGRIATVVTLDSPLGGLPFVNELCGLAPDVCGGRPIPAPNSSLFDMSAVWATGTGRPAGADRSVETLFPAPSARVDAPMRNQALALAAAGEPGVRFLSIGNVRDWLYAPLGPNAGTYAFLDTQWLTSGAGGSGVYARAIDSGPAACKAASGDLAASYACNHGLVLTDAAVGAAVVAVIGGATPALAASCRPGAGGCLMLPPRPATSIASAIAPGVVAAGGRFGAAGIVVARGGRATLRFTTAHALAGVRLEIWTRSRTGAYRRLTSRTADASGVVRYVTSPVTAWTAFQARYAGDFVHGPGASAGRVVTVR
jgi:hypothetical protein